MGRRNLETSQLFLRQRPVCTRFLQVSSCVPKLVASLHSSVVRSVLRTIFLWFSLRWNCSLERRQNQSCNVNKLKLTCGTCANIGCVCNHRSSQKHESWLFTFILKMKVGRPSSRSNFRFFVSGGMALSYLVTFTSLALHVGQVNAHGRLAIPPSRATAWR